MLFTDQLNRTIELKEPPKRIISLVPSQTEFLYDIGLEQELVGITRFCVHPEKIFRTKQKVGGTKTFDTKKISVLQPDLIIGNKEENDKAQIMELMANYPVWLSDVKNLDDACQMMQMIGALTERQSESQRIVQEVKDSFDQITFCLKGEPAKRNKAVYLIWSGPFMSINQDTFIHDMMERAGLDNLFSNQTSRYPVTTLGELKMLDPDLILLASEPYPFKTNHAIWFEENFPEARILLVNGELFSWYGSRLKKTPAYLNSLFGMQDPTI